MQDLGTIEDFRAQMYRENQGSQNIFIARKDFLQQIVGLYSKDTRFDLKKQPEVMFAGEMGTDITICIFKISLKVV